MWWTALAQADDSWDALRRAHPVVAAALATRGPGAADAAPLLLRADPGLVELLVPARPSGPSPDLSREGKGPDLLSADAHLEGTRLVGSITAVDIRRTGAWIDIDLQGGPAPDVRLGFGQGWSRVVSLVGGATPAMPPGPAPTFEGDTLSFEVELGALVTRGAGAVALVRSLDGRHEDVGPAGVLSEPSDEALDVLVRLLDVCADGELGDGGEAPDAAPCDADLAVAIAITFGALRPLVDDPHVAGVDADAVAWFVYGSTLDEWLEAQGATWRLGTLDPLGKLTWAWPAAQSVVYGAVPLAHQTALLDAEQWRFVVPDVATLTALRDEAPLAPDVRDTARAVDLAINARLRYRAHDALMRTLCKAEALSDAVCAGWDADVGAGFDLGVLAGVAVPMWEGVSATWQAGVRAREGVYVGDCATATALAITTLQALGIPALGMGWSGDDLATPTHDVPIWYDGERFYGAQGGPGRQWANDRAFVYLSLPGIHPVSAWVIGREPNGWSRGAAVAGGWTSYAEVTRILRDGLAGGVVDGWLDEQAVGGWPVIGGPFLPAKGQR